MDSWNSIGQPQKPPPVSAMDEALIETSMNYRKQQSAKVNSKDDLDDLLNEFGTDGGDHHQAFEYKVPGHTGHQSFVSTGGKCYPVFLAGTDLQPGMTSSSINPKACDKLRCIDCDKRVHRFENMSWKLTVDYLFVRNYQTNMKELTKGLDQKPGQAAYAC